MKLVDVAELSRRLKATGSILEKVDLISSFLKRLDGEELPIVVNWLQGRLRQGKINVGYGTIKSALTGVHPVEGGTLSIREVDRFFDRIKDERGRTGKLRLLVELMRKLSEVERNFIVALIFGEMRHGASEGVVKKAIARAFSVDENKVEEALTLIGDLGEVASLLFKGESIENVGVKLMRPIKPMLAEPLEKLEDIEESLSQYYFEFKLDGVRVQIHRNGDDVKIFSRHLRDITDRMPEVVELARTIPGSRFIVEGEVTALSKEGRPLPFQWIMKRVGRKHLTLGIVEAIPLKLQLFDVLLIEGDTLLGVPFRERLNILKKLASSHTVEGGFFKKKEDVERFLNKAVEVGHEGLMAKEISSPYRAGVRGRHWLKIKPYYTLDLVVLAAEWGHGRRRGWLSNLHLGTINRKTGEFLHLGKTFKGLSDEELTFITKKLLELKKEEAQGVVFVEPELVVEVAFNEIQKSPHYSSGFALRFARVLRIRNDKSVNEIDDIERVRELYHAQFKHKGKLTL